MAAGAIDPMTIVTVVSIPIITTLFALVVAMGRAIINHLKAELDKRDAQIAGVLATLVQVTQAQETAIVTTGQFVKELAGQQDYERRRNNERREGER